MLRSGTVCRADRCCSPPKPRIHRRLPRPRRALPGPFMPGSLHTTATTMARNVNPHVARLAFGRPISAGGLRSAGIAPVRSGEAQEVRVQSSISAADAASKRAHTLGRMFDELSPPWRYVAVTAPMAKSYATQGFNRGPILAYTECRHTSSADGCHDRPTNSPLIECGGG